MWERVKYLFYNVKQRLSRTILTKYLLVSSLTLIIGFILLGVLTASFVSRRWKDEQQELLAENARSISQSAARYFERTDIPPAEEGGEPEVTYSISTGYVDSLRSAIVMVGASIQSDVFIVGAQGDVLICSEDTQSYASAEPVEGQEAAEGEATEDTEQTEVSAAVETCRHRGKLQPGLVEEAAKSKEYRTTGTLSGIYIEDHFIVGIPIIAKNELNEDEIVAFVFAASSAQSVKEFRNDIIRVVAIVIIAASIISLLAVYMITYQQVRPLRQIAHTVTRFAAGDYNARVHYRSDNEVGQLAAAFNEMAEAIATSESMSRSFVANVSHELKTPMQTISGFIDGILDGTIPPSKQSQYLRIVSTETKRLARLVRSMLDLSRIDSGKMKLNTSRFDISNTIFTTLLSFEQKIEEKRIDIIGMEDIHPLNVNGDPDLIHQVIYNLTENAVKFTNEGGYIKLSVTVKNSEAYVNICNSGIGVPSDELNHIFDRFYKTDKSRSQDKTGVGLGLYIVKTIVTLHGGRIEARSEEGRYCEFEFHIPLAGPSGQRAFKGTESAKEENL